MVIPSKPRVNVYPENFGGIYLVYNFSIHLEMLIPLEHTLCTKNDIISFINIERQLVGRNPFTIFIKFFTSNRLQCIYIITFKENSGIISKHYGMSYGGDMTKVIYINNE